MMTPLACVIPEVTTEGDMHLPIDMCLVPAFRLLLNSDRTRSRGYATGRPAFYAYGEFRGEEAVLENYRRGEYRGDPVVELVDNSVWRNWVEYYGQTPYLVACTGLSLLLPFRVACSRHIPHLPFA